jgi:pantoate--beta-alanine ligase
MEIVRTVEWMKQIARDARASEQILGLVPTMGALHEGHLSLVRAAKLDCTQIAASIFVNPKQFGPSEDLQKYPRTFEKDAAALEKSGIHYLFAPDASEIYPAGFRTSVTVEGWSDRLEGRSRPGHFKGVTTVVLKLFEIVQPQRAYFGRKDAQQLAIIRRMATDLNLDTQVIACPIVREPDGLAMSSRNAYLEGAERQAATVLYRALTAAKKAIEQGEAQTAPLIETIRKVFSEEHGARLDYAEIVDAETLDAIPRLRKTNFALVAALVGKTRLIDNAQIDESNAGFSVQL